MNGQKCHYTKHDLVEALTEIGLCPGDVVFSHSNLGFLGLPEGGNTKENVFNTVFSAFMQVLGPEGTLCIPTFTYSFCRGEPFDPDNTPSTAGMFSEMVRQLPQARRSLDPIFSVACVGEKADELVRDISNECFGPGSFWERLIEHNGAVCNIGLGAHNVLIHYIENLLDVPYRYKKLFTGVLIISREPRKHAVIYRCRDLHHPATEYDPMKLDVLARKAGIVKARQVGRGELNLLRCRDMQAFCFREYKRNKWFVIKGPKPASEEELFAPSELDKLEVALSRDASMEEIVLKLWRLPRDIISDGYDVALSALTRQIASLTEIRSDFRSIVHEYPTGTEAYTWIVPEKWTCREAYLETLNGKRLFSYEDNPLHCMSYSLPFEGMVTREELFKHLYTHPKLRDAIPFKFKYYERDWGLCCSEKLKKTLTDEKYRVVIKTEFRYGKLKVGEFVLPGETEESVVLCAHLCHPHMVQDDLTGVAVGIEVMRRLACLPKCRYTYRLLFVPETIGSLCWLSHNEHLHEKIKGGLFLDILGLDNAPALQLSFYGDSQIDKCFVAALRDKEPDGWVGPYRGIIGNDERQFNSPDIRVPMLSLSRVFHPDTGKWPYPEYHSSKDTPETLTCKRMEQSVELVLHMLDAVEKNFLVKNRYKGEPFCSRYAIHIDYYTDPEANRQMFNVMDRIDGTSTIADIAESLKISVGAVWRIVTLLKEKGLVELLPHAHCPSSIKQPK